MKHLNWKFDLVHWMAWGDPRTEVAILRAARRILPTIGFIAAFIVARSAG